MKEFIDKHKLAALATVIGLGATAASFAAGGDKEVLPSPETENISVTATATEVVGGADSDYEHGAAVRVIENGLAKAAEQLDITKSSYLEQIEGFEYYDNAEKLLELASENNNVVLDKNDLLSGTIELNQDAEGKLSYEVIGAEKIDIPNNQE